MKPLFPALFASAALHAAVFATVQAGTAPRARQVEQRSVEIEVFATSVGQARPAEAVSQVPATPHAPARLARHSKPARAPVEAPAIEAPAQSPSAAETVFAPPVVSNAGSSAASLGQVSETIDLDLTAFFQRLQSAAQRCSGPRAGEGKVRFCVDAAGAPVEVSLVQSTGNFALDEAALNCVIPGAAPFPHTDRCLVVPLRFQ